MKITGDWKDYRPALWVTGLGVALTLLVSPPFIGAIVIGGGIGLALGTAGRRRRRAELSAQGKLPRNRQRPRDQKRDRRRSD